MSKRHRTRVRANRRSTLSLGPSGWLLGGAVAVVVVAVGTWFLLSGGGSETPSGITLPYYVRSASADVREAYTYAVEHPEVLQYIPCYCGCGGHSGHQSNWNCFVKSVKGSNVVFDNHGFT